MAEPDETYDQTRHPDLLRWLGERQDAHERWAEQTSFAGVLDFTPASLGVLDGLIRETANSMEEVTDQRMTLFIQGAIWYVGEVFCRHQPMVWKYLPDIVSGELEPFFNVAGETSALDPPASAPPMTRKLPVPAEHAAPDPPHRGRVRQPGRRNAVVDLR